MRFELKLIESDMDEVIVANVHSASDLTAKIEDLVLSYKEKDKIFAYADDGIVRFEFSEIECVVVLDRKTFVVDFAGKTYRINETLTALEDQLPSYFIRINRSAIANERRIKCFKTAFVGAVDVIFKSGYRDAVSRRCFAQIKRRYGI